MSSIQFPYISTYSLTSPDPPSQAMQNAVTLAQRANTALTNNQAFLAVTSPTNAQALAQIQALTRQTNGIIRFLLNQFDTISDS